MPEWRWLPALLAVAVAPAAHWESRAQLPVARTEVSAAAAGGRLVVAGGFLAEGTTSPRVDAYDPVSDSWTRLPDLPRGVNHAAAASYQGRVYVLGGYPGGRPPLRSAWVLRDGRWHALPPMPL